EGTVVDVEIAHHLAHCEAGAALGVPLELEWARVHLPHFIGGPDEMVARDLYNHAPQAIPEDEFVKRFLQHKKSGYHRIVDGLSVNPRPGFLEFFEWCEERGLSNSIGSLTESVEALRLIETAGLAKHFSRDRTVLREDVQNVKPDPEVFLRTAERMGI